MYRGYGIRRLYQVGGLKGITARSNKKKRRPKKEKEKKRHIKSYANDFMNHQRRCQSIEIIQNLSSCK